MTDSQLPLTTTAEMFKAYPKEFASQPHSLLSLPAEIRAMIYEYIVPMQAEITVRLEVQGWGRPGWMTANAVLCLDLKGKRRYEFCMKYEASCKPSCGSLASCASLVRTNKLIQWEVVARLYSRNFFKLGSILWMVRFSFDIGSTNAGLIRFAQFPMLPSRDKIWTAKANSNGGVINQAKVDLPFVMTRLKNLQSVILKNRCNRDLHGNFEWTRAHLDAVKSVFAANPNFVKVFVKDFEEESMEVEPNDYDDTEDFFFRFCDKREEQIGLGKGFISQDDRRLREMFLPPIINTETKFDVAAEWSKHWQGVKEKRHITKEKKKEEERQKAGRKVNMMVRNGEGQSQ